jgi:FkbM family methyltransferase
MTVVEAEGFKWFKPEGKFRNLPLEGWEKAFRDWVLEEIPKGGVFVDVGANVGLWTVTLAQHFDWVWAIEPHPDNLSVLRKNLMLNGIQGKVVVVEAAAWDKDGTVLLKQTLADDLASAISTTNYLPRAPVRTLEVPSVRIDSLKTMANFVKIDVEGGEMEVLKGMVGTIAMYRPYFFVEVHPMTGQHPLNVKALFASMGYEEWHAIKDKRAYRPGMGKT